MKKRILSVLLCLCMALVLLPTTALAETPPVETVTFGYAYDAWRDPDFPAQGDPVEMYSFNKPIINDSNERNAGYTGSWTLTRSGTYSYVKSINKNSSKLDSIVTTVASKYAGLDKDAIVIHELKDGASHIAYGVVLAYGAAGEYAMFLGDKWNSSGACYLLSTTEISGTSVTVTAGMIATDFVKNCSISLSQTAPYIFDEATEGYGDQTALDVTVTNEGNAETGDLTVSLSGDNPDAFVVDPSAIESIAVGGEASFTVTPKTGLPAGTYTATVTVRGTEIVAQSFDVTFKVKAAAVKPRPITPSDSTTTIDSPKTADNSGLFLWTVLLFASGAGVLGTAVYSSRKRRAE